MRYKTDINIILDRSGSMESLKSEVVNELNKFIAKNKETKESARVSVYQFDTECETIIADTNLESVREFNSNDFTPRGMTALYDAGCKYIDEIGKKLSDMTEEDRPKQIIVVFITDGLENASKEFTLHQFQKRLEHQRKKYKWQIVFIGSNEEGLKESIKYSNTVGVNNVISDGLLKKFGNSPEQMLSASFDYASKGIISIRTSNLSQVEDFNALVEAADKQETFKVKA